MSYASFTFLNELPSPAEIKQIHPLSDKLKALKERDDAAISAKPSLPEQIPVFSSSSDLAPTTKIPNCDAVSAASLPFAMLRTS